MRFRVKAPPLKVPEEWVDVYCNKAVGAILGALLKEQGSTVIQTAIFWSLLRSELNALPGID
jgi:hypothetical protein|tara:strand:- start:164 stop:349 length:186 start_codon:yes stop_codon:yes gene_type:complete